MGAANSCVESSGAFQTGGIKAVPRELVCTWHDIDWNLVVASSCVRSVFKDFKQLVHFREFEDRGGSGGNRSQFHIAIAFHGGLHATQKDLHAGAIELLDLRK